MLFPGRLCQNLGHLAGVWEFHGGEEKTTHCNWYLNQSGSRPATSSLLEIWNWRKYKATVKRAKSAWVKFKALTGFIQWFMSRTAAHLADRKELYKEMDFYGPKWTGTGKLYWAFVEWLKHSCFSYVEQRGVLELGQYLHCAGKHWLVGLGLPFLGESSRETWFSFWFVDVRPSMSISIFGQSDNFNPAN